MIHLSRGNPGESYRPRTHEELEEFFEVFCNSCEKGGCSDDAGVIVCEIPFLAATAVGEDGYPPELVHDSSGKPICRGFVEDKF